MLDSADSFVHAATRAFALQAAPPPMPADDAWVQRAIAAGVLPAVGASLRGSGAVLPPVYKCLHYVPRIHCEFPTSQRRAVAAVDLS